MKYSYMANLDFGEWSAERVLHELRLIGYEGVSWTRKHFHPDRGLKNLQDLVDQTKRNGLDIAEIVVQRDVVVLDENAYNAEVQLVLNYIETAGILGINNLNLFTGPAPWDQQALKIGSNITEGQAWDLVVRAFEKWAYAAGKNGVFLALEPVFGHLCHDYYTTQELLRRVPSSSLGINYDPSHLVLYRNDILYTIDQWKDRIRHVHLKDAVGNPGANLKDFIFPMLGEGNVPWRPLKRKLEEIGYNGFLTVEFESFHYYNNVLKKDPVEAARISMNQIKSIFEN